jgi:signal transduction histidine kinase/ligand-binding sensor domain-containing protein
VKFVLFRGSSNNQFLVVLLGLFLSASLFIPVFSLAQNQTAEPQSSPSPTSSPSPSPSPTPVTGLHQWGAVTLFHGLPSDRVLAIAQGSDGVMWFGTEGGLARFDGRRTQTITDSQLPTGRILTLRTDQNGALWIGTDNGAARMYEGSFHSIREVSGQPVTAIINPESRRIVMATEGGLIFECLTKSDGSLETHPLLSDPLESADADRPGPLPITSLTVVNNKLLAGTLSRGLLQIANGRAETVQLRPQSFFIRALEAGSGDKILAGVRGRKEESGFYRASKRLDVPTGTVLSIRAADDDVWVGTDGRGVFRFSGPNERPKQFTFDGTAGGLRSDHVYSIFVDREQVIWFGTDRGVCRYDPNSPRAEAIGDNPDSNFVRTLFRDNTGRIFAGTNRGLFVYSNSEKQWQPVKELARSIIYSIQQDDAGRLLVGSGSGFFVSMNPVSTTSLVDETFTRLETASGNADSVGSIRAITKFRGKHYIASFGRGLGVLEGGRVRQLWPRDGLSRDVISLFDAGNELLIGTTNEGVISFDGQQGSAASRYDIAKGTAVRSIVSTADGSVWLGTGRGVYLCRQGSDCVLVTPNFDARSLTVSSSKQTSQPEVWCATTGGGLIKIALDQQLGPVLSQFDNEQGLPSQNAFAALPNYDDDGGLLIGTNRGVVRYKPGRVAPVLYATRIISKRVHQAFELARGLTLEYPQNSLLLDVSAISSRTFPEQFQYGFLLSDSAGKIIKQKLSRESQFAMEGLAPGTYTVVARALTKDLLPSEPLSFQFSVAKAPFPWTSTALAVLLALALLGLLWATLERRRISRTSAALVEANRELAGARFDLANEAERERQRIARDLHDQTLADLRHLLLLSDQLPSNGEARNSSVFRSEIESISQEVRRICEDLSPSVLQNVGFAAALEFALSHAVQLAPPERKFEYEFVCDETLEERTSLPSNVQMQIYRIAQEVVNNICRHAAPKRVRMEVTAPVSGDFMLRIEDDGRGFDPAEIRSNDGRGLANMQARASLIGAETSWAKRDGGGTVFTLHKQEKVPTEPASSRDSRY